jgi:hypothetical protein
MMNGAPIAWRSKSQSATAQSTMESEVLAACDVMNEVRFLRALLFEFGYAQRAPTIVHEDNKACISFADQISVTDNNKHMHLPVNISSFPLYETEFEKHRQIRVDYHAIREAQTQNIIKFMHVSTTYQLADTFTKNLDKRTHSFFTNAMMTQSDLSQLPITSVTQNAQQMLEHLGPIPDTPNRPNNRGPKPKPQRADLRRKPNTPTNTYQQRDPDHDKRPMPTVDTFNVKRLRFN